MLNWTTGAAALATALKTAQVREVVTSQKLIDRLGIELPGAEMIFLEDLRKGMSKREQARDAAGNLASAPRSSSATFPNSSPTTRPPSSSRPAPKVRRRPCRSRTEIC